MFKSLFKNQLIKILSFNSVSVFLNFIAGFVSIKFIAHFLGAEGMAIIGNFKNFSTSVKTFSTLGFNNGITKLIAEHTNDKDKLSHIISTAFISRMIFSLIIGCLLILFSYRINLYVFENLDFRNVIILLALVVPFYSLNTFLISVLNGFKRFKKIITINIVSTTIGTFISLFLIWKHGLNGALISIASIESLIIIVSFSLIQRTDIPFKIKRKYFSIKLNKVLFNFSLMALTSALIIPNSHLYLRNLIKTTEGITQAEYWEAMNNISNYYMMMITSGLTLYYLPKLSETLETSKIKKELINYYKILLPVFLVIAFFTFTLRKVIVRILLNETFMPVTDFFYWQIIGDIIKVTSMSLGYLIVAKTMTYKYIFIEILFYVVYLISANFLIEIYQTEGVIMSYAIANFVSLIILLVIFRKLFTKNTNTVNEKY